MPCGRLASYPYSPLCAVGKQVRQLLIVYVYFSFLRFFIFELRARTKLTNNLNNLDRQAA